MSKMPSPDETLEVFRDQDIQSLLQTAWKKEHDPTQRAEWLCKLFEAAKMEDATMRIRLGSAETRVAELETTAETLATKAQAALDQRDQALAAVERIEGRVEGLQMAISLQASTLRAGVQPGAAA